MVGRRGREKTDRAASQVVQQLAQGNKEKQLMGEGEEVTRLVSPFHRWKPLTSQTGSQTVWEHKERQLVRGVEAIRKSVAVQPGGKCLRDTLISQKPPCCSPSLKSGEGAVNAAEEGDAERRQAV